MTSALQKPQAKWSQYNVTTVRFLDVFFQPGFKVKSFQEVFQQDWASEGFVASFPQELWDFLRRGCAARFPARFWRRTFPARGCIFPAKLCEQMSGEVLAVSFSGEVSRQVFRRVSGKLTGKLAAKPRRKMIPPKPRRTSAHKTSTEICNAKISPDIPCWKRPTPKPRRKSGRETSPENGQRQNLAIKRPTQKTPENQNDAKPCRPVRNMTMTAENTVRGHAAQISALVAPGLEALP